MCSLCCHLMMKLADSCFHSLMMMIIEEIKREGIVLFVYGLFRHIGKIFTSLCMYSICTFTICPVHHHWALQHQLTF